jgi:hypothetical protein
MYLCIERTFPFACLPQKQYDLCQPNAKRQTPNAKR